MNERTFRKLLPVKAIDSYKSVNGRVLCVAGCNEMAGAAMLCTKAAWYSGIGYLHLYSEKEVHFQVIRTLPVCVTHDVHSCSFSSLLQKVDSLCIGPGCDQMEGFDDLLLRLMEDASIPTVVDAYGLRVLAEHPNALDTARAPLILTPHIGEFSDLCHLSAQEIQKDRITLAQQFAQEHGITLVLKGPHTIVASQDGRLYINQTGHQNLAKAGSGDVLAGLIAGFCAQNMDPFTASCMAVWMHGKASDLSTVPDQIFSAADLIEALALVYKS